MTSRSAVVSPVAAESGPAGHDAARRPDALAPPWLDALRFAGDERRDAGAPTWTLDFDGDLRWPDLPYDGTTPEARFAPAARGPLAEVLDDARATLRARVPAAAAFVDAQLDRVLLRRDAHTPGASSGSHRAHVGACVLTNLHLADPARGIAVEALVHEAIHQQLYRLEARDGAFCDLAEAPVFRSPWTGARLPLHSLVHASFVWFGLAHLWAALGATPVSDAEAAWACRRAAHALFGFAFLDDLLDEPGFPRERIAPAALAALRHGATVIQRATAAADRTTTLAGLSARRHAADWPARLETHLTEAGSTAR